jgi:hypothetical protein
LYFWFLLYFEFFFKYTDDGGSIFEGAIQTGRIRPDFDQPLALESPTRSLRIEAGQDVELASGAGEVVIDALLDVRINAKQVRFCAFGRFPTI